MMKIRKRLFFMHFWHSLGRVPIVSTNLSATRLLGLFTSSSRGCVYQLYREMTSFEYY